LQELGLLVDFLHVLTTAVPWHYVMSNTYASLGESWMCELVDAIMQTSSLGLRL